MKRFTSGIRWIARADTATAASIQTFLARLLILVGNVVTGIITARSLGPEGRGELAAMTLWPAFLAYSMTFGLPSALLYNLKRYPSKRQGTFSAALILSLALGLISMLIGIVFVPVWLSQYSPEIIQFSQWFMLLTPTTMVAAILVASLEADSDFTTANKFSYLCAFSALPVLLTLAYANLLNPFTAALAYSLPTIPIFLWVLIITWRRFRPTWRSLNESYRPLFNYGLRSYGIDLIGTFSTKVDQILVVGLLTPASMGMYVVALSLSRLLNVFHSSVTTVLFPKTAGGSLKEVVNITGQVARINATLELLAGTAVVISAPILLNLFYGSRFDGAIPVFQILVVEVILGGTAEVLAQAFMALGRPEIVTLSQGIGLGASIPLMLLFIPRFGIVGAGIALICSTVVRLTVIIRCYPIVLKVPPPDLKPTRGDYYYLVNAIRSRNIH
jgi:O-antigen/teichoic acid export membrane protein